MSKGPKQTKKKIFATIACAICRGPIFGITRVILGGETAWEGTMLRGTSSTPVAITTKFGTIKLYWGTENQAADTTLNQYEEHPPYAGIAYAVFIDFDHGESTSAYNAEFVILGGAPDQSIITGPAADATTDSNLTVNPITQAVEVLTSPSWLGLPSSKIETATAQTLASAVQSQIVGGRCSTAVAPLYDSQRDARTVLTELAAMADAWIRVNASGKVEFGRWDRSPVPANVRTLTFDDLTDFPAVETEDQDDTPNSFAIEFTDRFALHKPAKIIVDDLAGIELAGMIRRENLTASHLTNYDQAIRAGQEAIRRSQKSARWSGKVRYPKALNFAGQRLQPGDLLTVPITAPGQTVLYQMIQVDRVTYPRDATAAVKVQGRFHPGSPASYSTAWAPPLSDTPSAAVPPVNRMRAFSLPATKEASPPRIHVVACRPESTSAGITVRYDSASNGDFGPLGQQGSFALPMTIDQTVNQAATTLRLSLLLAGANGEKYDRDSHYIKNWTGSAVEGRSDSLIVFLVAVSAGSITAIEACSVSGTPTLVDSDTFNVPVMRARLGTTALSWTAGAFTAVEVWVVPYGSIVDFQHDDFTDSAKNGSTLYFHAGAYDRYGSYEPAEAWAERQRRAAANEGLAEYYPQANGTDLYPIQTLVVPSTNYTAPSGFGVLTNSSAAVPSAADGSNPVLTSAVTTMSVFVASKDDSDNWTYVATPSSGITGSLSGRTWTTTGMTVDSGDVTITASRSGYANVVSKFVLAKAKNGTNGTSGISVTLSNPSMSMPSGSDGSVSGYGGTGTAITVFEGVTQLTYHTTLANGRYTIGAPTISPASSLTSGAISGSGTNVAVVADHTGASVNADTIQVIYPITVRRADGTDVSVTAIQTLTKAKAAGTGTTLASATLGSSVAASAGSWVDVVSVSATPGAGSVTVSVTGSAFSVQTLGSAPWTVPGAVSLRLLRDGSVIGAQFDGNSGGTAGAVSAWNFSIQRTETPGAGTYTYKMQVYVPTTSPATTGSVYAGAFLKVVS